MRNFHGRAPIISLFRPLPTLRPGDEEAKLITGKKIDDFALLRILGDRAASAGVLLPFAGRDEAQENTARRGLLIPVQTPVGVFCGLLDGIGDAAHFRVSLGGQAIALAMLPSLSAN
jgi:hypothetical protein